MSAMPYLKEVYESHLPTRHLLRGPILGLAVLVAFWVLADLVGEDRMGHTAYVAQGFLATIVSITVTFALIRRSRPRHRTRNH